ncbi:hypothetical protein PACTADRAFT_50337 [Pachysolen tannophilus NRRL Y-2460]|uniref:Ras-GEF domain-containing protein n=1 Tax=Pachysolen tannophilus NRRL Y-2460 TaxID=669874 RepID=A0A1E4TV56_PACTA|nr:hypothetical protein PACTADRAFT_50337 [Pachysolen tannophilus NRRL Y-2460]
MEAQNSYKQASISHGGLDNLHSSAENMDIGIFDDPSLYPFPTDSTIIRFSASRDNKKQQLLTCATAKAIVVQLTSPNTIDYQFLLDFFLTYRLFINSEVLLQALLTRLLWALDFSTDKNNEEKTYIEKQECRKLVLVRTFVTLRHWLLNYFQDDFINNFKLRAQFVNFMNNISQDISNTLQGNNKNLNDPTIEINSRILIELKNVYINLCSIYWSTIPSEHIPEKELLAFQLSPYENMNKSRLSLLGFQRLYDPSVRRSGFLSLHNSSTTNSYPASISKPTGSRNSIDTLQPPKLIKILNNGKNNNNNLKNGNNIMKKKLDKRQKAFVENDKHFLHPKDSLTSLKSKYKNPLKQTTINNIIQNEINYTPLKGVKRLSQNELLEENDSNHSHGDGFIVNGEIDVFTDSKINKIAPITPVKKMDFEIKKSSTLSTLKSKPNKRVNFQQEHQLSKRNVAKQPESKGFQKVVSSWRNIFHHHKIGNKELSPLIDNVSNIIEPCDHYKFSASHTTRAKEQKASTKNIDMTQLNLRLDILSARTIQEFHYLLNDDGFKARLSRRILVDKSSHIRDMRRNSVLSILTPMKDGIDYQSESEMDNSDQENMFERSPTKRHFSRKFKNLPDKISINFSDNKSNINNSRSSFQASAISFNWSNSFNVTGAQNDHIVTNSQDVITENEVFDYNNNKITTSSSDNDSRLLDDIVPSMIDDLKITNGLTGKEVEDRDGTIIGDNQIFDASNDVPELMHTEQEQNNQNSEEDNSQQTDNNLTTPLTSSPSIAIFQFEQQQQQPQQQQPSQEIADDCFLKIVPTPFSRKRYSVYSARSYISYDSQASTNESTASKSGGDKRCVADGQLQQNNRNISDGDINHNRFSVQRIGNHDDGTSVTSYITYDSVLSTNRLSNSDGEDEDSENKLKKKNSFHDLRTGLNSAAETEQLDAQIPADVAGNFNLQLEEVDKSTCLQLELNLIEFQNLDYLTSLPFCVTKVSKSAMNIIKRESSSFFDLVRQYRLSVHENIIREHSGDNISSFRQNILSPLETHNESDSGEHPDEIDQDDYQSTKSRLMLDDDIMDEQEACNRQSALTDDFCENADDYNEFVDSQERISMIPSIRSSGSIMLPFPGLTSTAIAELAAIPDDTLGDDPIEHALLKLEGRYVKEKRQGMVILGLNDEINAIESDDISSSIDELKLAAKVRDLLIGDKQSPGDANEKLKNKTRCSFVKGMLYSSTPNKEEDGALARNTSESSVVTPATEPISSLLSKESKESNTDNNKIASKNDCFSIDSIMDSDIHISFVLNYDSEALAKHFTVIEKDALLEIDWKELIEQRWNQSIEPINSWLELLLDSERTKGVNLVISRFNLMINWIISEVLLTKKQSERKMVISRYIHIAQYCKDLQNFSTLMQIVLALTSTKISSLRDTWNSVDPGDILILKNLETITSPLNNFKNLRYQLNNLIPSKGCIPFLGLYLSDLIFNAERPNFFIKDCSPNDSNISCQDKSVIADISCDKLINFAKFRTLANIVKSLVQCIEWSKLYNFKMDNEILSRCLYIQSLSENEMVLCTKKLSDP